METLTAIPNKLVLIKNLFGDQGFKDNVIIDIGGTPNLHGPISEVFYSASVYQLNPDGITDQYTIIGDGTQAPIKTGCVDIVISLDMIEHIPNPELLLEEVYRILKPGGLLFLSTPNMADIYSRVAFLFGYTPFAYDSCNYRVGNPVHKKYHLSEKNVRGHKSTFTHRGLRDLIQIHDYAIIGSYGYTYADTYYHGVYKNMDLKERTVGHNRLRNMINRLLPSSLSEGMLFVCKKQK